MYLCSPCAVDDQLKEYHISWGKNTWILLTELIVPWDWNHSYVAKNVEDKQVSLT